MARMTEDLKAMRIGDHRDYPVERLNYVKAAASSQGLILNRRYVTRSDRKARTVTVTRVE